MFARLQTKLTVLYAALFGAVLILIGFIGYSAIAANAERSVRGELAAGGAVFDRVWALREGQLREGALLLSRDFGFREALATNDEATIGSALTNLRARFGIDLAFIVSNDGRITSTDSALLSGYAGDVLKLIGDGEEGAGVGMIAGKPYQAIAVPVLAPTPMGTVVFASRLDRHEMDALEKLSAIPLDASVLVRREGRWTPDEAALKPREAVRLDRFVAQALKHDARQSRELDTPAGSAVALVKPLAVIGEGQPVSLLLSYPLARALAPYRPMLWALGLVSLLGAGLLAVGSWMLARGVTRPIVALDDAARRLSEGESVTVAVESADEIGRLAASFNAMASAIREREQRITHLALHDPATELPNRVALEQALSDRLIAQTPVFVAALGVDRFAHVRGAIGHALSDALIGELGRLLMQACPAAPVGRLSNDTLGLVLEAGSAEAARAMVLEAAGALEQPVRLGETLVDVTVTAGLAQGDEAHDLIDQATIALDQARAAHVKVATFDAVAYGDPASNLSLMSEMLGAMENGDLFLFHQPKLDVRAGHITGVEALSRWKHPTRGHISPDLFITMAEETGHILPLTEWVLKRAIADQAALKAAGHDLTMSVNISGRLLSDLAFAERALFICEEAQGKLCFEVTETAVIENPEVALSVIDRFAKAGIGVSIDDYGSGLSSLAYLKQIPADELKIDKSFVLKVDENRKDALLIKSTIDLAHSLGLKVTAEGVETETAYALLAGMGCDLIQGYLISRPQSLADLNAFLDARRETPAAAFRASA